LSVRPPIGVTGSSKGGRIMWLFNRLAVWRAGGSAVRITADEPYPFERLAGMVIGGGDDIGAVHDGAVLEPSVRVDPERDQLELGVLDWADRHDRPVLGICRGAQMLNIHRGGSLHPDIYHAYATAPRLHTPLPRKSVRLASGSRLGQLLGREYCRVNALHHQSVDRVGQGLRVVARDEAGIVQAIEAESEERFWLGVQWHPEFLVMDRRQQGLFRALVDAAAARVSRTG
jgi:putative glutamine amidotransferase